MVSVWKMDPMSTAASTLRCSSMRMPATRSASVLPVFTTRLLYPRPESSWAM